MVVLTGKNLGERHRELNTIVAEVVSNKKNFEEIKAENETTDIDTLYKIDVASQYRGIDYILEILKSGDGLHISRALKCVWLWDDTYSHIINVENLHDNIFPCMSIKMKKKMLTTASIHIKNKDRAASFYSYCKNNQVPDIAFKFLNKTSQDFKINAIKMDNGLHMYLSEPRTLENFVGNSFEVAKSFLETEVRKDKTLYDLRFLYSVCNEKYLDMIEENEPVDSPKYNTVRRFGIRISKDIMIKHKNRVLEKPLLYVNKLNKSMLAKYSTIDDAKMFLSSLMPLKASEFWYINLVKTYNYIFDVIPVSEQWKFLKQLFNSKYPGEEFEMTTNFYYFKYYEILTLEERESWALRHIDEKTEINGKDYIWYKFVKTDVALVELKKYIMKTPDGDKRSDILEILVKSTKDQKDLLKVLKYYYERHINEDENRKATFINNVLELHNVFELNAECWEALNMLLYSLEIYVVGKYCINQSFKAIAVCCHILHNEDLPQSLLDFVALDVNYSYFRSLLKKLSKDQSEIIFQHLLKLSVKKLEPFDKDLHNKKIRDEIREYIYNITNLFETFKRNEKDYPEIVTRFLDFDSPEKREELKKITAKDIYGFLKTDATLASDALAHFEANLEEWPKRLNKVLGKLKIYFPQISQEYVNFFERVLPKFPNNYYSYIRLNSVVYGIFQLADENYKIAFMEQYCPSATKIDRRNIDEKVLNIQMAICSLVGYSRPPVPLENLLKYIKGDYTQYCLPIFNMYRANLPLPLVIKFCEATLNANLSVQKHGLRLAFNSFTIVRLKELILKIWRKTKNVSLRMILYQSLFEKIIELDDVHAQTELFETLKLFTSELNEDDDYQFKLISSNRIPDRFLGDYLQASWEMVVKLPKKPIHINRQVTILNNMKHNIDSIQGDYIYKNIIENHVLEHLEEKQLRPHKVSEINELWNAKWDITAAYISLYENAEDLEDRLKLLRSIFERCLRMWNDVYEEKFLYKEFYFKLVKNIRNQNIKHKYQNSWAFNVPVLQHILELFVKSLPMKEIYMIVWNLELTIYSRILLSEGDTVLYDRGDNCAQLSHKEISIKFANQIAKMLKERLEKRQLYTIFLRDIAKTINNKLSYIQSYLVDCDNFLFMVCESLVDIAMRESYMLTLLIMPKYESDKTKATYNGILEKIESCEDEEIQCFLCYCKMGYKI